MSSAPASPPPRKITTARRPDAITIPIQALVQRDPAAEKALSASAGKPHAPSATATPAASHAKPNLVQGLYLLTTDHGKHRVTFTPVSTGVTGATDIEVLSGIKTGDIIVTGQYKVLRTLKSGTLVKIDNTPDTLADTSKS